MSFHASYLTLLALALALLSLPLFCAPVLVSIMCSLIYSTSLSSSSSLLLPLTAAPVLLFSFSLLSSIYCHLLLSILFLSLSLSHKQSRSTYLRFQFFTRPPCFVNHPTQHTEYRNSSWALWMVTHLHVLQYRHTSQCASMHIRLTHTLHCAHIIRSCTLRTQNAFSQLLHVPCLAGALKEKNPMD